jgi:hypothetical protein
MTSFFGISGSSSSSFFSNMLGTSSSSSSSDSSTSILSDYASIKSGAYGKLLKAYYAKNSDSSTSSGTTTTEAKALSSAKENALDLKESITALSKDSLYEKGDEDITKAVKSFVENYNNAIEGTEDIDNVSVLRSTLWMTNTTAKNESLLNDIGITIKSDNTLSLDEDALKAADVTNIKSLFQGDTGYGASVSSKASSIAIYAAQAAAQATATYTLTGTYDYSLSAGTIFDSLY